MNVSLVYSLSEILLEAQGRAILATMRTTCRTLVAAGSPNRAS
jgi:hypothetical protein